MSRSTANPGRELVLAAKRAWRQHSRSLPSQSTSCQVGICASFTVEPLVPLLGARLLAHGIAQPRLRIAPYNQIHQACLDHRAAFGSQPLTSIVILWRPEDLFAGILQRLHARDPRALADAVEQVDQLLAAIGRLRHTFSGTIVASSPPYPSDPESNLRDPRNATSVGFFQRRLLDHWFERIAELERVHCIDLDALQRLHGVANVHDPQKWYLYKQPYKETFLLSLADAISQQLAGELGIARKKCLVLDCDNTLWGGVIGEDGLEGIQLGEDFPGGAFRDFQRQVLALQRSGVLLALASKNNEKDVWEVFSRHDAMLLRKEHLAAWRIDWNNKADNILDIALELNIGCESLVFVDDNRFEIEQVTAVAPQVECFQVPEDPADLPSAFQELQSSFFHDDVTDEDTRRTEMIRSERERTSLRSNLSEQDFLLSLELEVEVFEAKSEHLARIVQLINKTNQFNLTTVRRSQGEVCQIANSARHRILALRARDKFGEYGLVGIAIIEKDRTLWRLDTFLLSCRILGRQIETSFIAAIRDLARADQCARIRGIFLPTEKNKPAADFFARHGFEKVDNGDWEAHLDAIPERPRHIELHLP